MRIASLANLVLVVLASSAVAVEPTPDAERVRAHAETLVAFGDRRAGSDAAEQAVAYLREQLTAYGYETILTQRTGITGPEIAELSLTVAGADHPVWLHRTNGDRVVSTPAGGLRAPLLFVDHERGLDPEAIRGRIVVVPADSGRLWMQPAALGAAAIIFNGPLAIDGPQLDEQHLTASVDMPRFVADLPRELAGQEAVLVADVEPARQPALTLVAHLPGTSNVESPEMVVLSTGYDTAGTVPGLDVGATPAWNTGVLLDIARQLKADPPRRDVLFVFEAGRVEAFRGLRQLLGVLRDPRDRLDNDDVVDWPGAPRADAQVVRLSYDLWRARLIRADFEAYLTEYGDNGTEDDLARLLRELDYLPEERDLFAGVDYPPSADGTTETGEEATDPNADYPFKVALALLLTALVVFAVYRSAKTGRPHPVLAGTALILIFFVDRALLARHAVSTETDVEVEAEVTYELGFRMVAEEAARRADAIQPILEDLRAIRSFNKIAEPDARITYRLRTLNDRVEVLTGRRFTAEELDDAIEGYKVEHRKWRDVQQRLGKRELTEDERALLPDLIRATITGSEETESNLERHIAILEARRADLLSSIGIRNALGIGKKSGPDPRLVLSLDLSDGNDAYSSTTQGEMIGWQNKLSGLNIQARRLARRLVEEGALTEIAYDPSPYAGGNDPTAWWPEGYLHQAAFANLFCNAMTLSTVNDHRLKVGTPADTLEAFRADNFLTQTTGLTALVRGMVESSVAGEARFNLALKPAQILIETLSEGSATGTKGFPYPLARTRFLTTPKRIMAGITPTQSDWGDAFGEYRMLWLPHKTNDFGGTFSISAYGFGERGRITDSIASDGQRMTEGGSQPQLRPKGGIKDLKLQSFPCQTSVLYDIFDPRLLVDLPSVTVLSATRDAMPNQVHVEVDQNVAAVFAPPGTPLRILAAVGQIDSRLVLLGDHIEDDRFLGLPPGGVLATEGRDGDPTDRRAVPTAMAVARDELQISKFRLDRLQENGISPENIWTLLAEGQRHLEAAEAAYDEGDAPAARGSAQSAWSYLSRVYPAVKAAANDVVYGLVVMLLLAIPFAAVCERLFVSANTIVGKVVGFSAFFVATFLFFFFFHPAFALATTPVIIFLAFVIIVMSLLVIFILYNRFEFEMETIRMADLGGNRADMSRLGTLFATGQLGISNMRRRPLRTTLTGITVVLMTFILLTFASFSDSVSTRRIDEPTPPAFNGVLVHMPSWTEMPDRAPDRIELTWGHRADIFERRWLMAFGDRMRFPFNGPAGPSFVEGVIGVRPGDPSGVEEALFRSDGERGFGGADDWIFLPESVRTRAGLEIGERCFFQGLDLRVGHLDEEIMAGISHLDGEPFTPLMASTMSEEQIEEMEQAAQETPSAELGGEGSSMTHLPPSAVAVVHQRQAKRLGAGVRSIVAAPYPEDIDGLAVNGKPRQPGSRLEVDDLAEDMAHELGYTLRVGDGTDNYLLTAVGKLSVAGFADVIIPLILGGLIIFSTMLGSVAERGKEIFIYASLGLAPIHIAGLFLVEAAIYAILGGLSGYMLAQMLVEFLGVLADFGWGVQPDLNYSSFTAVITILLVMATVLLSALYPAFIASRSAKPGDDTEFRVPAPDGDRMEIPFPFTVARRDIYGLLAFLRAYFDANTEASTGCFTAADAEMRSEGDVFEVSAKNWLAPFDLGISQNFLMRAEQTDVKAIYRIHITLELLSGQRSAWQRVLKPFLKDLRKQFLVWRTLEPQTMDRYRAQGGDEEAKKRLAQAAAEPPKPDPADQAAGGDEEAAGASAAERGSE